MKGHGAAWGAISFVNALATGVGAAAAISLSAHARVEHTRVARGAGTIEIETDHDTPLVRGSLLGALRRFEPAGSFNVRLRVHSLIPPARGLKSSSAVSVAIVRAVAASLHREITPIESAFFASDVGRATGLSATGGLDDALASACGGIVVADCLGRRRLRHDRADPDWRAVLWVPTTPHPPSPEWLTGFRAHSSEGQAAVDAARDGRYLAAMARNTELVEKVMRYDYRALRLELHRRGALAAGVSGMGPTIAAIVPARNGSAVSRALPAGNSSVMIAEFVPPGREPSESGVS